MSPSRRRVLALGAGSIASLPECFTDSETSQPGDQTSQPGNGTIPTNDGTNTEAGQTETLSADAVSLPETGLPLSSNSLGRDNYAPTASGPTGAPTARWEVTAEDVDEGDVRFTRPLVGDGRVYVGRGALVGQLPTASGTRRRRLRCEQR